MKKIVKRVSTLCSILILFTYFFAIQSNATLFNRPFNMEEFMATDGDSRNLPICNDERIEKYVYGTISNTQDYYFSSSAKAVGGFSGGPFLRSDDYVIGICHGYWTDSPDTSIGVRITQNMINIIVSNS